MKCSKFFKFNFTFITLKATRENAMVVLDVLCSPTLSIESKLSADNYCISYIPGVITHCPPLSLQAHLHSTLKIGPSFYQSNVSVVTNFSCRYTKHLEYFYKVHNYVTAHR